MSDSLQDRLRPSPRDWPASRRRHPVLAGVAAVVLAAAAAPLLLRVVGPSPLGAPPPPSEVGAVPTALPSAGADTLAPAGEPAESAESADSNLPEALPAPRISPFRRAHPWAAPLDGKYYYPSSCPAVLEMGELVFYRSERAARAAGLERGSQPGC
ncbi:MAG TPA: hypothetical protein VF046_08855 [Gemmatimonadales bacterium]